MAGSEFIARAAESGDVHLIPFWDVLVGKIRRWIRTSGFNLSVTSGDIRRLLAEAVGLQGRQPNRDAIESEESKLAKASLRDLTSTPEFIKWFGEGALASRISHNDGKPMVVYHGTDQGFTTFKVSKEGAFGRGIYLTSDPSKASTFAGQDSANGITKESEGQNVMPVYTMAFWSMTVKATSMR